ncbi:MAG: T9SS type A sorting domain-containing protein [Ignavibacteriae bacterium]|nr:T9SS C-terminal target domain-containing protein [Ignavibacteriota bacterium]NOG97618.1 T9SS type A sorting domain-containing protein [Ignavibacteriota bacterium]
MKKLITPIISLILILAASLSAEGEVTKKNSKVLGSPSRAYMSINNVATQFVNNGESDRKPDGTSGCIYPKGSGKAVVFTSGLIWGTQIENDPQVRVGGSTYRNALQPGKILPNGYPEDPNLPKNRIYRVRPDVYTGGPYVDLTKEAEEEGKTEQEVRLQYEKDWNEWPAQDGAPYTDVNSNGEYNRTIDIPGVPDADQTIWYVANDLDPNITYFIYGTNPIGIELQVTIWAYKHSGFLDNVIFRKYKMINKSSTSFDDMYISLWSDPDIGEPADDFTGCDTLLNLGYAYNSSVNDPIYGFTPGGVGFNFLETPNDLEMTAFYYFGARGDASVLDPTMGDAQGATQFYNFMQGRIGLTGELFTDPHTNTSTTFALAGDPLTEEGWYDGQLFPSGDRRMGIASGPFQMAVGDTQEVVVSEIAAAGIDNLNVVRLLRYYSGLTTQWYNNIEEVAGVPEPPVPVITATNDNRSILLQWDNSAESFLQDGYEFQGYNIYQLTSDMELKSNAIRLATFDKVDGITQIPGPVMNSVTGYLEQGIEHYGSDSGIENDFLITEDLVDGTPNLIVGKPYYFAVTAYAYNSNSGSAPSTSESIIKFIEATVTDSSATVVYGDPLDITHSSGTGDGIVYVTVDDPTKLTGDSYEVFFNKQKYIRNEDGIWVPVPLGKISGQDDMTGSTIDIAAVYGTSSGVIEISCHFNNTSPNGAWADGITIVFPDGVTILEAPNFQALGGTVYPEIAGQSVNFGLVNNQYTQNGVFHGDEDWKILVAAFQPPISIDWTIFDDGWEGNPLHVSGQSIVAEIGLEIKIENHWNLRNGSNNIVLEDQTVIMGYDLYTGEYVGDPVVDGFKISVDADYDPPITMGKVLLNGEHFNDDEERPFRNSNWHISDYTDFGFENATSNLVNGYGTLNSEQLEKDYNIIWNGQLDTVNVNGKLVIKTKEGTGSIATLYGARLYNIADHPLNPIPGSNEPFLVRVPFEVWNIDDGIQINYQIYDRLNDINSSEPFKVWNDDDRMYAEVLNTPYIEEVADPIVSGDYYTWNHVWYMSNWQLNDTITIKYLAPIRGNDQFTFTTPSPLVAVNEKVEITDFNLSQNYPNPFNPNTTINFTIPQNGKVKLSVFNILGQRVAVLINNYLNAGAHTLNFDASKYASGVYFYKMEVYNQKHKADFVEVKKMILLK